MGLFEIGRRWHAHVALGCKYVGASVCQALFTLILGLPLCAVPLAILMNMAGEAMVSRQRSDGQVGRAKILPVGWTAEDVNGVDDVPYYMFFLYRSLVAAFVPSSVCTLFVAEWRGVNAVFGWPLAFAILVVCAGSSGNVLRIWLLAEGHVHSQYDVYIKGGVYALVFSLTLCIVMSAAVKGSRRQLIRPFLILLSQPVLIHFAISFVHAGYYRSPHIVNRLLGLSAVQAARVVSLEVGIYATSCIRDCSPQARAIVPWVANMFTLGAIQIMQISAPELGSTALLFFFLAAGEAMHNIKLLTKGTTVLTVWFDDLKLLVSWICSGSARVHSDGVVPIDIWPGGPDGINGSDTSSNTSASTADITGAVVEKASDATHSDEGKPSQPVEDTDAQTHVSAAESLGERKALLASLVVATNLTEILIIATVATVFLIARLNPAHFASGPWPLEKTFLTAGFAFLFEVAGDFIAVFEASRRTRRRSELYQVTSVSSWTDVSPWRTFALCLVAMIIALDSMSYLAVQLCPRPRPGTQTLHVIGVCA